MPFLPGGVIYSHGSVCRGAAENTPAKQGSLCSTMQLWDSPRVSVLHLLALPSHLALLWS